VIVSVVIPTLDEAERIALTVAAAVAPGVEVLVVDGGSADGTVAAAERAGARVLTAPRGRGAQLAAGAAAARGEILLFVHADTRLPAGFAAAARATLSGPRIALGAFRLGIDAPGLRFRCVELLVRLRCALFGMPYGDQALFVRRELYGELGGFANLPAMEDFDFVLRARRRGRVAMAPLAVRTSARAWRRHGVLRLSTVNLLCAIACRCGVPAARVAGWRQRWGLAGGGKAATVTSDSTSSRTA
jgi:rSAM/selenodomain-associated transferase 2